MKYCQGPKCHEHKTKDRIRGPKGDKHYETRKKSDMPYGNEWCSMQCYNDWLNKFGKLAVDHFGRIHEPKRAAANSAWYKTYSWRGSGNDLHYFVNDLLGERKPITERQYQDKNIITPNNLSQ